MVYPLFVCRFVAATASGQFALSFHNLSGDNVGVVLDNVDIPELENFAGMPNQSRLFRKAILSYTPKIDYPFNITNRGVS